LISVVVLNYRRAEDTMACVRSIMEQADPDTQIIVVDNHSQDSSAEKIREFNDSVPRPFAFLELDANRGFSAGNNAGIRFALDFGAQYVWLLNNDTVLQPGAFEAMRDKADDGSILGSVLLDFGTERIQTWGGGVLHRWTGINRNTAAPRPLDYLTGASFLFPARLVDAIGLWDETFFLDWEDIDFSLRASSAGFGIEVADDARIWHKGAASIGKRSETDVYHRTIGCFLLYRKHFPARLALVRLFHLSKFVRGLLLRDRSYLRAAARAYRDFGRCPA
jgi:GT2 family glycosyltransferase